MRRCGWPHDTTGRQDEHDRGGGADEDLSRSAEEGGRAGCPARALPPRVPGGARGRRDQLPDRAGRDGGVPGPERRGQDDDAEDALGADLPDGRRGAGAGIRPLAAGGRVPPPVRAGDGPEEPALVGPAGRRQLPAPAGDLRDPTGRVPRDARRADGPAGRGEADPAGGARALAGRADEDGADRRAPALGRGCCCSTSRRSGWTSWRRG